MKELIAQLLTLIALIQHGSVTTYTRPEPVIQPIVPIEAPTSTPLTVTLRVEDAQELWLEDLIHCESRGNPNAVNPVDLDGTPSYGLLQFKPSTFTGYRTQYGLPDADLMDPEAQKETVRHMMQDPGVNWYQQFPACTRRLGLPPMLK